MPTEHTENTPFAYQLQQHVERSFTKIAALKDKDIQEQIERIFLAVQDPNMQPLFEEATNFLTYSVKGKIIRHIINNLKIDVLKLLPKVWSSYLDRDNTGLEECALNLYKEETANNKAFDYYSGLLRGYLYKNVSYNASYKMIMDNYLSMSAREAFPHLQTMFPITVPQLFWHFNNDFDDSKKIAKLKEALISIQGRDFVFFKEQVQLMNLLADALPENIKASYKNILDTKQQFIEQHIASLPEDLQLLEKECPGITSRVVTALATAISSKDLMEFKGNTCPALFEEVEQVSRSNNLTEIIEVIQHANLHYAEDSFYCEKLQRDFFQVEEIKVASSYMRYALHQIGEVREIFNNPVFSDPNDIKKLVDFCSNDNVLAEVAGDLLEDTYSIMEDLVEGVLDIDASKASGIGINKKGLNYELAYFVVGMLVNEPEYKEQSIYDYTFIKAACSSAVKELQSMTTAKIKDKLQFFIEAKKSILSNADQEFDELIESFNEVWNQQELLKMQREWYKLSANLNIWAISQALGNSSLEYNDDIEEKFNDKAIKHYRVLPAIANEEGVFTLTYLSQHNSSKNDAPLEITEVFSYLKHRVDSVSQAIAKYAKNPKAHNTTNFVSSELIFVIGSEPHNKKTELYKRLFVKISVKLEGKSPLISLGETVENPNDVAFQVSLNNESEKGIQALDSPALVKGKKAFCSERALFLSFKAPQFASAVVTALQDKINSDDRFHKAEGEFKVYGTILAEYSTFTSCDRCCGATVAQHLKESESFLPPLEESINSNNGQPRLFTKGTDKGSSKFKMMTFVASGASYNTQTDDLLISVGNPTYNSAGQIFLEQDALDLNKHLSSANPQPLIEFPNFTGHASSNYFGSVYMSGASKAEKYTEGVERVLIGLENPLEA